MTGERLPKDATKGSPYRGEKLQKKRKKWESVKSFSIKSDERNSNLYREMFQRTYYNRTLCETS